MYYDRSDPLKNTEEVPSIGEGQLMQPVDEQPFGPSADQQPHDEPLADQGRQPKITRDLQKEQARGEGYAPDSAAEAGRSYRGVSEQVVFPSAPAAYQPQAGHPWQAGAANQPGQAGAPAHQQPGQPAAGPAWGYPPRPEYYQQRVQQPGAPAPITQPHPGVTPNQQGYMPPQQHPGAPAFYSSATIPAIHPGGGAGGAQPRRSGIRTGALLGLSLVLILVFGTGIFAGWQFGRSGAASSSVNNNAFQPGSKSTVAVPQPNGSNADQVREAVISKVQPGIVQITVVTGNQQALGSGVIIDGRGYIVTNNHVVEGASSIQVTLANNQTLPGKVVGTDSVDDLAVISITPPAGGLSTVTMGDSSQLKPGQEVLAIGSPLGNAETVTRGIISALNRNVSEGQNGPILPDAIQTDAPINPGNSGGALVDLQGNLIGMPTLNAVDTEFNTPANGLGFAIPVNRIRFIAQQIITDGHVTHTGRPILGITVTTITSALAEQRHLSASSGVLVVDTTAGGPAASAGLKANDVITQLDNRTINSTSDLSAALLQQKPGDSVALKINRGGQQLTLNVTLGELSAS